MACETEEVGEISRFWRNVLIGAGNVLCLFPHAMQPRSAYQPKVLPQYSVADALGRDWQQIGMDMGRAIEQEGTLLGQAPTAAASQYSQIAEK